MLQVYLAVSVITPACLAGAYIEEGGIVVDWKRTIMLHLDLVCSDHLCIGSTAISQ